MSLALAGVNIALTVTMVAHNVGKGEHKLLPLQPVQGKLFISLIKINNQNVYGKELERRINK